MQFTPNTRTVKPFDRPLYIGIWTVADTELTEVTGYMLWDWYSNSEQGSFLAFTVKLRPSLAGSSGSYAESTSAWIWCLLNRASLWQLKNKNQLDATNYFIVFLRGSTCFGHYYARHQELATIILITILVVSFLVTCRLEVWCGYVGVVSGLQAKACTPDTTPA